MSNKKLHWPGALIAKYSIQTASHVGSRALIIFVPLQHLSSPFLVTTRRRPKRSKKRGKRPQAVPLLDFRFFTSVFSRCVLAGGGGGGVRSSHWQTGLGLLERRGVDKNARKRRKACLTQASAAAATLTYHASYRSFLNGIRLIAQTTSRHRLAKAFISQDWGGATCQLWRRFSHGPVFLGEVERRTTHTAPRHAAFSANLGAINGQEMPFLSFGD